MNGFIVNMYTLTFTKKEIEILKELIKMSIIDKSNLLDSYKALYNNLLDLINSLLKNQ